MAMNMTKIPLIVLLIALVAASVAPLHAAPIPLPVVFQFDELGDLAYSLSGAPYVTLADGILESDPTNGFTGGEVLVYNLTSELAGFDLFNGDVPIGSSGGLAGDLRFTDSAGATTGSETSCGTTTQCLMIFYVFDSYGLPADIGDVSTSFLLTQTPGTTLDPGQFSYTAGVITYDGTIVPEPAPAVMLLFGLAVLVFLRKRPKATIA
jgi:hypothetical protein